jgi:hypothetical protein
MARYLWAIDARTPVCYYISVEGTGTYEGGHMTTQDHTRLMPKKRAKYVEEIFLPSISAHKYEYMETRQNPALHGETKEYAVILSTTGNIGSGHVIATFPNTEEGYAAAEQCVKALTSTVRIIANHEINLLWFDRDSL